MANQGQSLGEGNEIMPSEFSGPARHPSTPADWNEVAPAWAPELPRSRSRNAPPARIVTIQFWSAYAALFVVGVFIQQSLGIGSTYDGASTLIAAPIALLLTLTAPAITLGAVALPGLAIRLVPRLRSWWISHSGGAAAGTLVGIALLCFAYVAGYTESGVADGIPYSLRVRVWPLLTAGWFVLAFFALHLWLPLRWGQSAVDFKTA